VGRMKEEVRVCAVGLLSEMRVLSLKGERERIVCIQSYTQSFSKTTSTLYVHIVKGHSLIWFN